MGFRNLLATPVTRQIIKTLFSAFPLLITAFHAQAKLPVYGVVNAGYSQLDIRGGGAEGGSVRLALGMELHRQWNIEVGFQDSSPEQLRNIGEGDTISTDGFVETAESQALMLSMLGKARGSSGELYYRIGAVQAKAEGQYLASSSGCPGATPLAVIDTQGATQELCRYDDNVLAAAFGLGFDYFITPSFLVRTEAEYIGGENGYSVASAFVGVRYNFW